MPFPATILGVSIVAVGGLVNIRMLGSIVCAQQEPIHIVLSSIYIRLDSQKFGECFVGGNVSSTIHTKIRFLSAEGAGDMIASAFAILRTDFVHDGDVAAVQSFGRTSTNLCDIAPRYSLLGRFFSKFSGLGPSESTAFLISALRVFTTVCRVTLGVASVRDRNP